MATTGTTTFLPDLAELTEEAFERAGLESFNGYDLATARRSMNFMLLDWANRGLNTWTVEQGTQALTAEDGQYNLPTDTVDLLEAYIRTGTGTSQVDYALNRISFSVFSSIPTKNTTGRPIQYYVQRNQTTSTIDLWPLPDSATTYTLVYWRMRRMYDAGAGGAYDQDVPFRFLPALVSGLAYHIAVKKSKDPERILGLKAVYDEDLRLAQTDDRDRSSWFLRPHLKR
jgi:hypothetical protein